MNVRQIILVTFLPNQYCNWYRVIHSLTSEAYSWVIPSQESHTQAQFTAVRVLSLPKNKKKKKSEQALAKVLLLDFQEKFKTVSLSIHTSWHVSEAMPRPHHFITIVFDTSTASKGRLSNRWPTLYFAKRLHLYLQHDGASERVSIVACLADGLVVVVHSFGHPGLQTSVPLDICVAAHEPFGVWGKKQKHRKQCSRRMMDAATVWRTILTNLHALHAHACWVWGGHLERLL